MRGRGAAGTGSEPFLEGFPLKDRTKEIEAMKDYESDTTLLSLVLIFIL